MKIISLNAFFGHEYTALMDFITLHAPTTDVFCFQEMLSNPKEDMASLPYRGRPNILQEITKRLPDFDMVFAPMQDDYDITPAYPQQLQLGIATFFRRTLSVRAHGSFFIYNAFNTYTPKDYETVGHNALFLTLDGPTPFTIVNLHGNSEPAHKRDTEKRLAQSGTVIDFLRTQPGEHIVMGDFNLFPDTESVRLFERAGYRNLITEYGITTTRGTNLRTLFPEYANGPHGFQDFADYTFVSHGVTVQEFSVPDVPVSDHLPMILTCSLSA